MANCFSEMFAILSRSVVDGHSAPMLLYLQDEQEPPKPAMILISPSLGPDGHPGSREIIGRGLCPS